MANIYDVAERAGVSHTTVARVMTGKGVVSAKTREKVEAAAKALSYTPSTVASSLAKGVQHNIVIALSDKNTMFYQLYRLGALKAKEDFESSSFNIEFADLKSAMGLKEASARKLLKSMKQRRCSALLLMPDFPLSLEETQEALDPTTRLVQLSFAAKRGEEIRIGVDQRLTGRYCASYFSHLNGDDEVLLYYNPSLEDHIQERCIGFKDEMSRFGCRVTQRSHMNDRGLDLKDMIVADVKERGQLKGIMVPHASADRAAEALKELERPDVRLVGFDVTENNLAYCREGWIDFLIHQQPEMLAYEAVMQLGRSIYHRESMQLKTLILPTAIDVNLAKVFVESTEDRFGMPLRQQG